MKWFVLVTVNLSLLCFLAAPIFADDLPTNVHQQTNAPTNARFEIVQSQLAAKFTFRLDKFTGHVAMLVKTSEDENISEDTWEDMHVYGLPPNVKSSRPHFQIFTSGLAACHTFLIDTDSGQTWLLVKKDVKNADGTENEVYSWQKFAR